MSTKKTIFLSDQAVNFIQLTSNVEGDGITWTNQINAALQQLQFTVSNALPELSIKEWETLLNCYAGCYQPAFGIPARIASDLMDNIGAEVDDLDDMDPDYQALIKKCAAMSQAEQMAVLYFIQIFWANDWNHCIGFNDVIKQITQKLSLTCPPNEK